MKFTDGGGKQYEAKVYKCFGLEKIPNIQWKKDRPVYRNEWNAIYSQIMIITCITVQERSILRGFCLRCGPNAEIDQQ